MYIYEKGEREPLRARIDRRCGFQAELKALQGIIFAGMMNSVQADRYSKTIWGITVEFLRTDSLDVAIVTLFGNDAHIADRRSVYDEDINQSYRLSLSDGSALFMKRNTVRNLPFFTAEAQGLATLHRNHCSGAASADGSLKSSLATVTHKRLNTVFCSFGEARMPLGSQTGHNQYITRNRGYRGFGL